MCRHECACARRSDGSAAAQMQEAAMASKGQELLETWLILEYCDQGSFDHAIRNGRFAGNLPSGVLCLMDIAVRLLFDFSRVCCQ